MFFGSWIHTLKKSMPNVFTWVMTSMISEDIMIGDIKKKRTKGKKTVITKISYKMYLFSLF